jgi:hypothetical protein
MLTKFEKLVILAVLVYLVSIMVDGSAKSKPEFIYPETGGMPCEEIWQKPPH